MLSISCNFPEEERGHFPKITRELPESSIFRILRAVPTDVLVLPPMGFAKPQFDLATIGRLAQCLVHAPTATRILP